MNAPPVRAKRQRGLALSVQDEASIRAVELVLQEAFQELVDKQVIPSAGKSVEYEAIKLRALLSKPPSNPASHYTTSVIKNAAKFNQHRQTRRSTSPKPDPSTAAQSEPPATPTTPQAPPSSECGAQAEGKQDSEDAGQEKKASERVDPQHWARLVVEHLQQRAEKTLVTPHMPGGEERVIRVQLCDGAIPRGGGFIDVVLAPSLTNPEVPYSDFTVAASLSPSSSTSSSSSSSPTLTLQPPSKKLRGKVQSKEQSKESKEQSNVEEKREGMEFVFRSIGRIECAFRSKYGTPRQGAAVPASRARLTFDADIPEETLEGLEKYSHIWLHFIFHENTNKKFHAKIAPPRLDGSKVGVFASRSPHRVNPLGLSLVRLRAVQGRTLLIESVDLIHGTPIVDINPYHPSDCAPDAVLPMWVTAKPHYVLQVSMGERAEAALRSFIQANKLQFYDQYQDIYTALEQTLGCDPRPVYTKQHPQHKSNGIYGFYFDRMNVLYGMVDDKHARILYVELLGNGELPVKVRAKAEQESELQTQLQLELQQARESLKQ